MLCNVSAVLPGCLHLSIDCQAVFSAEMAVFSGNIGMLLPFSKCSSFAFGYNMYRLVLKQ